MDVLWIVVVLYVVIVALGRSQQKARRAAQQARGPGGPPSGDAVRRRERLEELRLAIEQQLEPTDAELLEARQIGATRPPLARIRPPQPAIQPPVVDYDQEAIRIAEQRRRAAETAAFLPTAQAKAIAARPRTTPGPTIESRIESRIASRVVPPPGAVQADATRVTPASGSQAGAASRMSPAASRLAVLADGRLRGVFVLSEILGPPRGDL